MEILYDFLPDGTHKTHLVGPTRPESPLMSGPFIREDEELRADMSPSEQSRVLELRRIRQGGPYHLTIRIHKHRLFGRRDGKDFKLDQKIELKISQDPYEASTTSILTRLTSIKFTPAFSSTIIPGAVTSEPGVPEHVIPPNINLGNGVIVPDDSDLVARAEEKAKIVLLKRVGIFHEEFTELSMTGLQYRIPYDAKGLCAIVKKGISAIKDEGIEGAFEVSTTTELKEVYTVRPGEDAEEVDGIERRVCEEVVHLAREVVQGVLEFAFVHNRAFRPLEGASTGVMEVRHEAVCEFCEGRHRNGDCELGWEEVAEVNVDDGLSGMS